MKSVERRLPHEWRFTTHVLLHLINLDTVRARESRVTFHQPITIRLNILINTVLLKLRTAGPSFASNAVR